MNWTTNAERMRPAVIAAVALFLCLSPFAAIGQRRQRQFTPQPRMRFVQRQNPGPRNQHPAENRQRSFQNQQRLNPGQRQFQNQRRPYQAGRGAIRQNQPNYGQQPTAPSYPQNNMRQTSPRPAYTAPAYPNPARPYNYPSASRPGHLGAWLNQHQGVQNQEQLLHNNPNFNRLPPAQQQRLVQQLHNLDQMPEARRERTLARAEMFEKLSPQEQTQVRDAGRQLVTLPAGRQEMVKRAFQDLRSVPLDQRPTVLNSARYQNNFSPEERSILGNLLRAEPYEPPR